ncbi:aspartate carbamoyltransferase regulatory subunit [Photobacterium sanguinicancri]|uniref:Aspartate carbamoyltransferase regulatory chain n=1 Tax=Photobacterium sanguinicancri TaxID=875932 RepID=A0AAW7Y8K0_9GAMM|nr:aspartate carbamoyltransferase regulatory subunit [Photobacterium sanguinicancri]KXI21558.1 aspartate carbamoyltransferase regulatory subunit [Photobacterium sanguinicancri]MDO6499887.1 aspartate carbamoyltransferase regulatory subunit [Photobacterium sanguinicancri]MDO6543658.1 aspartate carbamoyltransferase regulatory subunit [Photobacterium sanguinicancri]OZS41916.1 aspartate carbamoyltransferase regulatory subunit [Photobacterium sanguinicancri]OZS45337.1 aspartate carbamoyltransferase 
MTKETQLQVEAIKNGTVIDHIPANVGIKVLKLFKMHKTNQRVTIGLNLPSSAQGAKDLIKIENVFISEDQANQLAMYAPKATVNQIENYEVAKKLHLTLPEQINGIFECPNSNCISHGEPVDSSFKVITKKEDIQLKCKYCEKVFSREIMTERR